MSSFPDPHHTIVEALPDVVYELNNQTLELSRGEYGYTCSKNESLVWALCDGHTYGQTVAEIRHQFGNLPSDINEADKNAFVDKCLQAFVSADMLSLKSVQAVQFPLDISGFSHFYTSRGGIYAINQQRYERIAYGMFFGIEILDDQLIAYDFPHRFTSQWRETFSTAKRTDTCEGVIRSFPVASGKIHTATVLHQNIANNCHHLVNHRGTLFGVDTEAQSVFSIDSSGNRNKIPMFDPEHYHHINSLSRVGSNWLLMKCIRSQEDTQSAFAIFDEQWNLLQDIDLPASRAHDFLPLNDDGESPSFWYCDSANEHIRRYPDNASIHIKPHLQENSTTRGLSQTQDCWVVGSGQYGRYYEHRERQKLHGAIHFIDKSTEQRVERVLIPEAPCCIIQNPWYDS